MRAINDTPYKVSHQLAMYTPGEPFLTVVVKGTFALVENGRCRPLPDKEQAPISQPTNFMDRHGNSRKTPADVVPFKPRADCLFVGSAFAPGGSPVESLEVTFAVGGMRKTLVVFGDRNWLREADGRARLTRPVPFVELPIRAEYAHGGFKSKYNMHGIGFGTLDESPGASLPAANILPRGEVSVWFERDVPHAGFGVLPRDRLPRRALAGTFDEKWITRRRPLPPEDFDVSFFNTAPLDQQVESFLVGDEPIHLENLHPHAPQFRSELPGTHVRCFAHRQTDAAHPEDHEFVEIATVLDTCIVNVPEETLTLVWRGTLEIVSRRLERMSHLYVVEEPLNDPQPAEIHAARLHEKLVDKRAAMAAEADAERRKKAAALQVEGLGKLVKMLKDGGASTDLVAALERQTSLEDAQKLIVEEIEKIAATLPKKDIG
jgi:hypothetical protein